MDSNVGVAAALFNGGASGAQRPKLRRGSKSMGHNVDKVCKHNMLRFGFFPLDRTLAKCNQPTSLDIFLTY
jgi:hypothetical protein